MSAVDDKTCVLRSASVTDVSLSLPSLFFSHSQSNF